MNQSGYKSQLKNEEKMPALFFIQTAIDPLDATKRVLASAVARLEELKTQADATQQSIDEQQRVVEYWQTNLTRQENQKKLSIARENLLAAETELENLQQNHAAESAIDAQKLSILAIRGVIAELERDLIPEAEKLALKRAREEGVAARVHASALRMRTDRPRGNPRRPRITVPEFQVQDPLEGAAAGQLPRRVPTPPSP